MGRERIADHLFEDVAIYLVREYKTSDFTGVFGEHNTENVCIYADGTIQHDVETRDSQGNVLSWSNGYGSNCSQEEAVIAFMADGFEITAEIGQVARRTHITHTAWDQRLGLMTHRKGW